MLPDSGENPAAPKPFFHLSTKAGPSSSPLKHFLPLTLHSINLSFSFLIPACAFFEEDYGLFNFHIHHNAQGYTR